MRQSSGERDAHKHGRSRPPLGSEQQVALWFGVAGALGLAAILWWGRGHLLAAETSLILLVFGGSMAIAALLGAIVVYFIVMPRVSRPGAELAFVAEAIASGDLSRSIRGTTATGVLDRIRTAMQGMLVALRTIALELRTTSIESADRAREISAGCGTAAGTAQRISATTSDLARQLTGMAGTLREIASVGMRLRESSATISADVHEGNERNARLRQLASENRVRLEESGQALTELVAGTETSALEIEALAAASEEIRAFVTLVRKMARQSKLLALNAAMEAARAGEHGEGFAVVASEVRRLARSSAEAAEKTDVLVTDVLERVARARTASSHAVVTVRGALAATEHGLGSFLEVERGVIESEAWAAAIDGSAAEASTVVAEMSSRLEEVASAGETVAIAMRDVARASEAQNSSSRDIAAASLALADSAARVATVVGTFRLDAATKAAPPAGAERSTPSPLASSLRSPQPAAT